MNAGEALQQAHAALERGDRGEARRHARLAAKLAPEHEAPWLYLAATAEPRAGLAYLAKALEVNPKSKAARKAIRWMVRRLPPAERRVAVARAGLPENMAVRLVPLEALMPRRLISHRVALLAALLVVGFGFWLGREPAEAQQPQFASDPIAKASLTPTPTNTPTSTPTPTLTPTPTFTPTPTPTDTPTPRPALSWEYSTSPDELANEGRWIDVDLSAQMVTAYEGAEAVRAFVVSTGTAIHPTVTGQFRIYIKLTSTPMAGPGYYLPGVPYTMYFYKGYALHGTYWHSNFGTPMSHGCINLTIPDSEWLFHFAEVGTLVNVHP
jgi:lipoprotein-anchoring transpeptidase ErfK/SrfK